VQGVFFRDTARQVARRLNIKGSAVNLSDGTVEIVAEGTPEAVKKFQAWLMIGPDMATVTKVETVDLESQIEFKDFRIG
jgi:acylphosphatase